MPNSKKKAAQVDGLLSRIEELERLKLPQTKHEKTEVFRRDGHAYWMFKDLVNIPKERQIKVNNEVQLLFCGLSSEEHKKAIKTAYNAYFNGSTERDAAAIARALIRLKDAAEHAFSSKALLNIASLIILRDDEQPHIVNTAILREKKAYWKEIGVERSFLDHAWLAIWELFRDSKNTSRDGLKEELSQLLQREKEFLAMSLKES